MLTFIAFLLTILGAINWLSIGLLQYDFIAGWFGYQASIFSRLIYILFGVGAVYLIIRVIVNKGSVKVFESKKQKKKKLAEAEASKEQVEHSQNGNSQNSDPEQKHNSNEDNLFDEMEK